MLRTARCARDGRIGLRDPRQDGDVVDDDGWHGCRLLGARQHHSDKVVAVATTCRARTRRRLRDMTDDDRHPHVRPATPAELADVRGMHAANRRAWDEAAERYEGWFAEAVELISVRRHEPARRRARAHRRPPRSLPAGDPPPVRRRPRHALALEPGGGRGRRRRLQPAHARARGAPVDRGRRARALDRGGRPRHAARARRDGRPRLHRSRLADVAAGPRCLGGRRRTGCWRRAAGSSCSRAIRPSGCSTSTMTAAGSRPTTTTSPAPRRRRAGRPSTSTGCRSPDDDQAWKFARAWTLGRGRHGPPRRGPAAGAGGRAPDRLVGRPRRRPGRRARPHPAVVLGPRPARRLAGRARPGGRRRPSAGRARAG